MISIITALIAALILFISVPTYANYGARICKTDPQLTCHKVKHRESWESLFPKGTQLDTVMRLNRMNVEIYPGMIIAVPKNLDIDVMDLAPFKKQINPPGEKVIFVSLNDLAWGAYDASGTLQKWGPVSGGAGYCRDLGRACNSATGQFSIYQKEGFGCKSTKFPIGRGGAPMPYCMFFHGGFALHGSYDVPGYNASHGCIRMYVSDAKWLNKEFVKDEQVAVVVKKK